MAPNSHGRTDTHGESHFGNGSVGNGPPPSTLAAQLVGNIAASDRSSRPDETAELKKFFAVIENVKDNPDLLETPGDRLKHNHMLIYVYVRVVLEGLKWDDPFADRTQFRTEGLRTINFLRITLQETPEVLAEVSDGESFLFRGRQPLWRWILPKVLKMLGHSQCLDLTAAIEGFLHDVYLIVCRTGSLWLLLPHFSHYFTSNFDGECCDLLAVNKNSSG